MILINCLNNQFCSMSNNSSLKFVIMQYAVTFMGFSAIPPLVIFTKQLTVSQLNYLTGCPSVRPSCLLVSNLLYYIFTLYLKLFKCIRVIRDSAKRKCKKKNEKKKSTFLGCLSINVCQLLVFNIDFRSFVLVLFLNQY